MKPAGILKGKSSGFTLLEVIVALIVGSILGAILLEFLGQTVHKSFEPIKMAQGEHGSDLNSGENEYGIQEADADRPAFV